MALFSIEWAVSDAQSYRYRIAALSDAGDRTLLKDVGPNDSAEDDIRAQIVQLYAVLQGELIAPDSEDADATYGLFAAALDLNNDPPRAWKVVLTAMLQDVRVAYY